MKKKEVTKKKKAVATKKKQVKRCPPHHWKISKSRKKNGEFKPRSKGVCKYCGKGKYFSNVPVEY